MSETSGLCQLDANSLGCFFATQAKGNDCISLAGMLFHPKDERVMA